MTLLRLCSFHQALHATYAPFFHLVHGSTLMIGPFQHVPKSERPALIGRGSFDSNFSTEAGMSIRGPSYETMHTTPAHPAHMLRSPAHLRPLSLGPPSPTLYNASPPPPNAPIKDLEKAEGPSPVMHAGHLPMEGARVAFERSTSGRSRDSMGGRSPSQMVAFERTASGGSRRSADARAPFERTASSGSARGSARRIGEGRESMASASHRLHDTRSTQGVPSTQLGELRAPVPERTASATSQLSRRGAPDAAIEDRNAGVLDTLAQAPAEMLPPLPAPNEHPPNGETVNGMNAGGKEGHTPGYEYTRRPSITPVLLPEYRYCMRDEVIKPLRAHHCRLCGTVSPPRYHCELGLTVFISASCDMTTIARVRQPSCALFDSQNLFDSNQGLVNASAHGTTATSCSSSVGPSPSVSGPSPASSGSTSTTPMTGTSTRNTSLSLLCTPSSLSVLPFSHHMSMQSWPIHPIHHSPPRHAHPPHHA